MSDLIERGDAIKALYKYNFVTKEVIEREIMSIPSADRPRGEWQYIAQGWHSIRRCSNCGWTQTNSDPKYLGYRYNYCPNCGARMKGADDERG